MDLSHVSELLANTEDILSYGVRWVSGIAVGVELCSGITIAYVFFRYLAGEFNYGNHVLEVNVNVR